MKTTYAELKQFVGLASAYLHTTPTENALTYALRRTLNRCETAVQPLELEITDQKIALASVDEKKNLTFDPRGNYQFSRENYQALTKFLRELDAREIELEPFAVTPEKIPAGIQGVFRDAFEKFNVLPPPPTDRPFATDEDLLTKASNLCGAIEALPASEQQTSVSVLAGELRSYLAARVKL